MDLKRSVTCAEWEHIKDITFFAWLKTAAPAASVNAIGELQRCRMASVSVSQHARSMRGTTRACPRAPVVSRSTTYMTSYRGSQPYLDVILSTP